MFSENGYPRGSFGSYVHFSGPCFSQRGAFGLICPNTYPQANYNLKDRPDRVLAAPRFWDVSMERGSNKGQLCPTGIFLLSFKASGANGSTFIFLRLCLFLVFILHFLLYWSCLRRTVMMMDTNRAGIGFSCWLFSPFHFFSLQVPILIWLSTVWVRGPFSLTLLLMIRSINP